MLDLIPSTENEAALLGRYHPDVEDQIAFRMECARLERVRAKLNLQAGSA